MKTKTKIDKRAFLGCERLSFINLDGVQDIEEDAFARCTSLQSEDEFVIIKGVLSAYRGDAEHIVIPDGINVIDDHAFENHKNLKSITFPSGLQEIGGFAFSGCSSLERVVLPNGVWVIGARAFMDCINLVDIQMPASMDRIKIGAFEGCRSLTSVNIPDNVSDVEYGAFFGCSSLTSVSVHPMTECDDAFPDNPELVITRYRFN